MTIKIHIVKKSDLSHQKQVKVSSEYMTSTTAMAISHYAGAVKSTSATVPFTIEGVGNHIPQIDDVEFCVVIRRKADFTAVGPNSDVQREIGKDTGKYKYTDNVPPKPLDLPPGFQEVYKKT